MPIVEDPPHWYWRLLSGNAQSVDLFVSIGESKPQLVRFVRTGRTSMASTEATVWSPRVSGQPLMRVWQTNHPDEPFMYQLELVGRISTGDCIHFAAGKISMALRGDGPVKRTIGAPAAPLETSARQPCSDCAFNTRCPPYFSAETVRDAVSLPSGMRLMCHQTTGKVCAGWRVFRHNAGLSDDHTRGLDLDSPVYKDLAELWAAYDNTLD